MAMNDDAQFELVARKAFTNGRLVRAWPLHGGVSARVTALEIERPDGSTQKVVVRQHGPADLARNPNIAEDEFRLLQILKAAGVAAPVPYYAEQSGEIFSTPYIVVEFVDGDSDVSSLDRANVMDQLASGLAEIHSITPESADLSFLPRQTEMYAKKLGERPAKLDESLEEGRIREALGKVWPLKQSNPDVLLHGDYWPGNTLWKDGRLVGIIDWEDARVGDPLEDLANSRLEIMWTLGIEAMHGFTRKYVAATGIDAANLAIWDLCAALRPANRLSEWAADDAREKSLRKGHHLFVMQAFESNKEVM